MAAQSVSFRVLSAVEARRGSAVLRLASPRQRALLAQLLVNANQTVSPEKLIEGIWGGTPPQHPEAALHVVVCRLRRSLGAVASRVVRDSSGYRIEVKPDELDLARAEALAADAHGLLSGGDPAPAAAAFDAALACFTGEPLADLANFPFYDATARCLREFRLGLIESRNAAYLRCGRHLDVLSDIDAWIETEPWRERLRAHQMVALYRSDRQIEALAAYDELRRLLISDFGVDPHEDLQRLHGRILRRDAGLLVDRRDVQSREVFVDLTDVVMVEGGPGVNKAWLVAEVPTHVRDAAIDGAHDESEALRRVSLTDWLASHAPTEFAVG